MQVIARALVVSCSRCTQHYLRIPPVKERSPIGEPARLGVPGSIDRVRQQLAIIDVEDPQHRVLRSVCRNAEGDTAAIRRRLVEVDRCRRPGRHGRRVDQHAFLAVPGADIQLERVRGRRSLQIEPLVEAGLDAVGFVARRGQRLEPREQLAARLQPAERGSCVGILRVCPCLKLVSLDVFHPAVGVDRGRCSKLGLLDADGCARLRWKLVSRAGHGGLPCAAHGQAEYQKATDYKHHRAPFIRWWARRIRRLGCRCWRTADQLRGARGGERPGGEFMLH